MVSDQEISQLWRDPNFSGSYRGIKTFQILLKTDKNIDISEKQLYRILKKDSIFLIHQKPARNFDRRPYDIRFYGETVQAGTRVINICQLVLKCMYICKKK